MRLLQCPHCKRPAIGPPTQTHPDGEPLVIGHVGPGSISFKCNRCRMTTRLRSTDVTALPQLSKSEIEALGFRA